MVRFIKIDIPTLPRLGKPFLTGVLPGDFTGVDRVGVWVLVCFKPIGQYDADKAVQNIGFRQFGRRRYFLEFRSPDFPMHSPGSSSPGFYLSICR
jgi:hypothetical protein